MYPPQFLASVKVSRGDATLYQGDPALLLGDEHFFAHPPKVQSHSILRITWSDYFKNGEGN